MEFTPDGTDIERKKAAVVVYAITLIAKVPYIVRDEYEAELLLDQLKDAGYYCISMPVEVPIEFRGWHFPRPMKPSEPSLN